MIRAQDIYLNVKDKSKRDCLSQTDNFVLASLHCAAKFSLHVV